MFLEPHPYFSSLDRMKLSKILPNTNEKGLIKLHPKGFEHPIKIRKNYTDREVAQYVLQDKYHLPPREVVLPKRAVILDLGTNIGLTVAHFKNLYTEASIYGFEMNPENYQLALHNTKSYKGVFISNQAVWINNDGVTYSPEAAYDSYAIDKQAVTSAVETQQKIPSITIGQIIAENALEKIDYLKMDIEGAEEEILSEDDLTWLTIVDVLNIEMHFEKGANRIKEYMNILEKQGFHVRESDAHWSSIFAIRKR